MVFCRAREFPEKSKAESAMSQGSLGKARWQVEEPRRQAEPFPEGEA
jgi:hypothetical protein